MRKKISIFLLVLLAGIILAGSSFAAPPPGTTFLDVKLIDKDGKPLSYQSDLRIPAPEVVLYKMDPQDGLVILNSQKISSTSSVRFYFGENNIGSLVVCVHQKKQNQGNLIYYPCYSPTPSVANIKDHAGNYVTIKVMSTKPQS